MKISRLLLLPAAALLTLSAAAAEPTARELAAELLPKLTIDEKISLMMDNSPAIERLNIPAYNWWNEALHGVGRAGVATVLPQSIGMAATFDPEAIGEAFDMVSTEARAKFNGFRREGDIKRYEGLSFWTPNVNIFRDPRWGRGQETYGEDPYLTSEIGRKVVAGLQGDPSAKYLKTLAGAKHYAVHSGPEWNRHSFDAKDIDQRDLWETYLPSFKTLVDADVWQVMCAYNRFEGEPCCSNKRLLTQILRGEWGYDKIIVTDCWALRDFVMDWGHNTHSSEPLAAADAVSSGTDLECGPLLKNLRAAYDDGLITEAAIDSAVMRLLEARFRLGEINAAPDVPWNSLTEADVNTPANRALALDMARKSMTLLKNDGILPLDPNAGLRIMVMGPNATDSVMQWGNYSGTPAHTTTILDGIRTYAPQASYLRGCDHVVSSDMTSRFDLLDGGLKATYYNDATPGTPAAEAVYTTPLTLTTGGATVFAPGVDLTDFSAIYRGTFTPDADSDYLLKVEAGKDDLTLLVDGREVAARQRGGRSDNKASYMLSARAGERHDIELRYGHGADIATLNFDILTPLRESVDVGDADVVIFVGGISPKLEGEEMKVSVPGFRGGDRESIELPKVQRDLMARLAAEGKKVIMVNCSGSAVALAPEDSVCSAILQAWYPGQDGGLAVADVIFGAYNPAGRLPVTFYRDDSQLPDFEDYSMAGRTYRYFRGEPLYPFGHGLSYTTFAYGEPTLSSAEMAAADGTITLSVPVSNTGARDGEEVVQVYMTTPLDPAGPVKTLRAFKRVAIPAGTTETVSFTLDPATFATYDPATGRMTTRPGSYTLSAGPSSASTPVSTTITLK